MCGFCVWSLLCKNSEYDQEIPQAQTADNIVLRVFSSFAIIVLVGLFVIVIV